MAGSTNERHTPDLPWEPDPAIPGFKRRLLHVNPATGAQIKLWHLPPAFGAGIGTLPRRHYHRTVTERAYHLAGDFPHWEFRSGADMNGELIVFKRHIFMDRPPLSLHGRFAEPHSQTGSEILYWNTGLGTGVGEPEAANETVDVDFGESGLADRTNFRDAHVYSAEDRPWLQHPHIAAWKAKPLAPATEGTGAVVLVNVPHAAVGQPDVEISGSDDPHWLFLISGDLKLRIATNAKSTDLAFREGSFLSWCSDESLCFPGETISDGGAVVLCASHNLAKSIAG